MNRSPRRALTWRLRSSRQQMLTEPRTLLTELHLQYCIIRGLQQVQWRRMDLKTKVITVMKSTLMFTFLCCLTNLSGKAGYENFFSVALKHFLNWFLFISFDDSCEHLLVYLARHICFDVRWYIDRFSVIVFLFPFVLLSHFLLKRLPITSMWIAF